MSRLLLFLYRLRTEPRRWGFVVAAGVWSVVAFMLSVHETDHGRSAQTPLVAWVIGLAVIFAVAFAVNGGEH